MRLSWQRKARQTILAVAVVRSNPKRGAWRREARPYKVVTNGGPGRWLQVRSTKQAALGLLNGSWEQSPGRMAACVDGLMLARDEVGNRNQVLNGQCLGMRLVQRCDVMDNTEKR